MSVVVFPAVLRHDQHKDGCGAIGRQLGTPALALPNSWLAELLMKPPQDQDMAPMAAIEAEEVDKDTFHIWSSIQKEKTVLPPAAPYVHPLTRRSSSLMSQKSLEICTESLGSETGSDGFSSGNELDHSYSLSPFSSKTEVEEEEADDNYEGEDVRKEDMEGKKELAAVNYHCSIGRRSQVRSFPPPLSSISRRDGTCLRMQPHRRNGRLVMEAVPVPSHNYLHAQRHGGRLLLSLVDSTSSKSICPVPVAAERSHYLSKEEFDVEQEMLQAEEEEEDELVVEEEEVEVVDRGTIVEVKVSTQPQQVSGAATVKVHRSSLVINKFVVGSPLASSNEPLPELDSSTPPEPNPLLNYTPSPPPASAAAKRASVATTTAAAAAVAASSISTPTSTTEGFHYNYLHHHPDSPWGSLSPAAAAAADAKLLFASKRRSREELLHDMRRCSELRRPLFIFEQPHCIATSS